jgi:hypothetical protein
MPQPLRIEYPGAWHNIMNHGRRSEDIFKGEKKWPGTASLPPDFGVSLGPGDF